MKRLFSKRNKTTSSNQRRSNISDSATQTYRSALLDESRDQSRQSQSSEPAVDLNMSRYHRDTNRGTAAPNQGNRGSRSRSDPYPRVQGQPPPSMDIQDIQHQASGRGRAQPVPHRHPEAVRHSS